MALPVDGMSQTGDKVPPKVPPPHYDACHMPPANPLPMAAQDFAVKPATEQPAPRSPLTWRLAAFGPAIVLTVVMTFGIMSLLAQGGLTALEAAATGLVALTFIWVSLSVSTTALGLAQRLMAPCLRRSGPRAGAPQTVALLVPIYNEAPQEVFGNAAAMLAELDGGRSRDSYALFILSDTRDPAIAALEERAFWDLHARAPKSIEVTTADALATPTRRSAISPTGSRAGAEASTLWSCSTPTAS